MSFREHAQSALRELVAGFDKANRAAGGSLLAGQQKAVYPGLVAVVLRIVAVLFAESRGLLSADPASGYGLCSLQELYSELLRSCARSARSLEDRHGAWQRLTALFRLLHQGASGPFGQPFPGRGGRLFDPDAYPFLEGRPGQGRADRAPIEPPRVSDGAVLRVLKCLIDPGGERLDYRDLSVEQIGAAYEGVMGFAVLTASDPGLPPGTLVLTPGEERRRQGAHYTSRALTRVVVQRTLAPLVNETSSPHGILALRICDPAMGSGAFLLEACRQLAERLAAAWERAGAAAKDDEETLFQARRSVARSCLYGVDKDPVAVDLARLSLWLETRARDLPFSFVDHSLRDGDSLLGLTELQKEQLAIEKVLAAQRALAGAGRRHAPFHWQAELGEVFAERGGFDAILGNPPWVSYAGRAAQPLSDELRSFYLATSPVAFAGYRNLQGIFVHRAATMLRPGGRLGLVLPTSMSDLGGYEPSRRAHDEWCVCDSELPDFGDAFDEVFQPSMGLLSTRREARVAIAQSGPWPLERRDLDPAAAALLERLSALPRMPPGLFGERGFQTTSADVKLLQESLRPRGRFTTAVRVGGDIEPFLRRPPQLHCDPGDFAGRFRAAGEWQSVKLLIRQTARYPMATLSDGLAFRNSILAGFADGEHSAQLLLAYLNSSPLRWFHYFRHRDARQGMPQLKIGHLRAFPDLPPGAAERSELERIGAELAARNSGITPAEQARIDALVAAALGLDGAARERIAAWAGSL